MVSAQGTKDSVAKLPVFGLPFLFLLTREPFPQQWEFFLLGSCLLVYVVMFIIWIMIAVWVYRDAQTRGMNAGVWVLIVLLIGIIGLIIYLIVRTDQPLSPPAAYGEQPPYGADKVEYGPVDVIGEETPKKSKVSVSFMGVGAGEKLDKVPVLNKVPTELRVALVVVIVIIILMATIGIAGMVRTVEEPSDPNVLNSNKLDEFTGSGAPITDYLDEFTDYSTILYDVMGGNGTFLVGVVTLTLDWTDEPDTTELGRVRVNEPDNFQLELNIGGSENRTVQSEITGNSKASSGGSGQIVLSVDVGAMVNGYVAVGNMSGRYLADEVIYSDIIYLVVYLHEAEDKYASGPAALKWNDFGNEFTLSVSCSGLIVPDA